MCRKRRPTNRDILGARCGLLSVCMDGGVKENDIERGDIDSVETGVRVKEDGSCIARTPRLPLGDDTKKNGDIELSEMKTGDHNDGGSYFDDDLSSDNDDKPINIQLQGGFEAKKEGLKKLQGTTKEAQVEIEKYKPDDGGDALGMATGGAVALDEKYVALYPYASDETGDLSFDTGEVMINLNILNLF